MAEQWHLSARGRHSGNTRQEGFTLLEVIIALTLLSLMMTVLFNGLRFGARAWDAAGARVTDAADHALVQQFIRRRLQQAQPVLWTQTMENPSAAFAGTPERLSFVAPLPARRGVGGLYEFTLAVTALDGVEQFVVSYRLFHPDTLADAEPQRELLAANVRRVTFSYFGTEEGGDRLSWQNRWQERAQLPLLVRLQVEQDETAALHWPPLTVALRLGGQDAASGAAAGQGARQPVRQP